MLKNAVRGKSPAGVIRLISIGEAHLLITSFVKTTCCCSRISSVQLLQFYKPAILLTEPAKSDTIMGRAVVKRFLAFCKFPSSPRIP